MSPFGAVRRRTGKAGAADPADQGFDGIGFLLGVAHRSRRRRWESSLADLGLTAPQAAVLRLVSGEPGHGVRHIARQLGTDPMNAQRIVETLIAADLCEPRSDPGDARRRPLYPTARGDDLAEVVTGRALRAEEDLAEALGTGLYQALVDGLQAMIALDDGPAR